MIPLPSGLTMLLFAFITLVVIYFTLTYFWLYPDAWSRGQNPREWAIIGAILIVLFNFIGLILWLILYLNARRKVPSFSLWRGQSKYRFQR